MKKKQNNFSLRQGQVAAMLLLPVLVAGCKGGGHQMMGNMGPQEYAVVTLEPSANELKQAYPATIRGKQDVEIRPNVSGFITKLCVDEGATVQKGQVLFIIDPVPYEAAVKVAEANVNVAQASVETAELTAKNKRELQQRNIISEYDLQMAENALASQKALLAQANAQLVNARNNLSYTEVKSPSNGVIGTIPYRLGSLVRPSITMPLTTVSDISEMYIYFSMNEKNLLQMTRQGGSLKDVVKTMPAVELQLADGSIYPENGKVDMISGVIDPSTGAVSLRATFPNKANVLRSGGSGSVLTPAKMENTLTVPQAATFEIQDKRFVYVLQPDTTVKSTEIKIYNVDNGKDFVVTEGLNPGDRIVVEGTTSLRDGTKIKPITPEESAAKVKALTEQNAAAAAAAAAKK